MSVYALAAAVPLAAFASFTAVAALAVRRADSTALPAVLRELTALAGILLRRRRR